MKLKGKNVVISGVFNFGKQKEVKHTLSLFGANIQSKVSHNTDILLIGSNYKKNSRLKYKKVDEVAEEKAKIYAGEYAEKFLNELYILEI